MSAPGIACALLAAGGSQRLGHPKQLVSWRGTTLVRALAIEMLHARESVRGAVLGHEAERVAEELEGLDLHCLVNACYREGMAASVRVAVRWAMQLGARGLILCACDQPRLTSAHLDALAAALDAGAPAVASLYAGTRGVPAGFAASWFERLLQLQGDQGARVLLRASPEVHEIAWDDGAFDIDTPEDAASLSHEDPAPKRCS